MVVGDLWSLPAPAGSGEEHLSGGIAELGPCLPAQVAWVSAAAASSGP